MRLPVGRLVVLRAPWSQPATPSEQLPTASWEGAVHGTGSTLWRTQNTARRGTPRESLLSLMPASFRPIKCGGVRGDRGAADDDNLQPPCNRSGICRPHEARRPELGVLAGGSHGCRTDGGGPMPIAVALRVPRCSSCQPGRLVAKTGLGRRRLVGRGALDVPDIARRRGRLMRRGLARTRVIIHVDAVDGLLLCAQTTRDRYSAGPPCR